MPTIQSGRFGQPHASQCLAVVGPHLWPAFRNSQFPRGRVQFGKWRRLCGSSYGQSSAGIVMVACSSGILSEEQNQYSKEAPEILGNGFAHSQMKCSIGSSPLVNLPGRRLLISKNHSFILLNSLACLVSSTCLCYWLQTTGALVSLIITAIMTLNAMRRVASSLEKLADTAREELPGTMAAIRLSGMEISDLTVELSDLSQEISDGVRKSAQAVQAAEVGIRRVGALASSKAKSILKERANLPVVTIKPAMTKAARTTSNIFRSATEALLDALPFSSFSIFRGNKSDIYLDE